LAREQDSNLHTRVNEVILFYDTCKYLESAATGKQSLFIVLSEVSLFYGTLNIVYQIMNEQQGKQ